MLTMMYKDAFKTEGTITDMCGIEKNIIQEKEEIEGMKIPTFSVGIQSNMCKQTEIVIQTDLSLKGIKEMENKIAELMKEKDLLDKGNQLYETELQKLKDEIEDKNKNIQGLTLQSEHLSKSIRKSSINEARKSISKSNIKDIENSENQSEESENSSNSKPSSKSSKQENLKSVKDPTEKLFVTDEKRKPKSKKLSKKHTLKNSSASKSKSKSKSKSRLSSIDESPKRHKSPLANRKYVYCKDWKRRRLKRQTVKHTINKEDEEPKSIAENPESQLNETNKGDQKIHKNQNKILVSNIRKKFNDPGEESDFKVDESIYSAASLDSVYSWGYGKKLLIA